MISFQIGDEVLFDDERYVIAGISQEAPVRYRLLSTTAKGAQFVWTNPNNLKKLSRYTEPYDDTAKY